MGLCLGQIGGYIISLFSILWYVLKQFCGLIAIIGIPHQKQARKTILSQFFFLYMIEILKISTEIIFIFLWSNCGLKPVKSNHCFILHFHLGILIKYMSFMCYLHMSTRNYMYLIWGKFVAHWVIRRIYAILHSQNFL